MQRVRRRRGDDEGKEDAEASKRIRSACCVAIQTEPELSVRQESVGTQVEYEHMYARVDKHHMAKTVCLQAQTCVS